MHFFRRISICGASLLFLLWSLIFLFQETQANTDMTCLVPAKNQTIQQAINDSSCDVVQISAGTHTVNLNVDREVIIEGAGIAETILDGGDSGRVFTIFNGFSTMGNATIRSLTIQNGRDDITGGGGIYNEATATVSDVRIINNHGQTGAGLLSFGDASLNRVEVSGNVASGNGGGVHVNGSAMVTVTNVTLSGNSAMGGSALSVSGDLILLNSTIYTNTDLSDFATISNYGTLTTTNSIIAGGNAINCDGTGAIVSLGHNLADDTSCNLMGSGDVQNISPGLKALADNGGSTMTHALLPNSDALDMGDDAACPAVDQRGQTRPDTIVFGKMAVCDIGAFEAGANKLWLPLIVR